MKISDILRGKWIVDHQTVLLPGEPDNWDGDMVYTPHIIKERDYYRMYHTARDRQGRWAIATATSTDLFHWIKHPTPLLSSGADWDKQIDFPWPIKVDNMYYLFYEAKKSMAEPSPQDPAAPVAMTIRHMFTRTTGMAKSKDGIHFQKHPEPVIGPDPKGTWDHNGICASRVYRFDRDFCMFYAGSDGKKARSGLAFSDDLIHWRRYEKNPVIDVGPVGAWDSVTTLFGSVLKLDDGYLGAYEGEDGKRMQLGLAYSSDLKHWTRFDGNPIVKAETEYDQSGDFVCAPHLILHEGSLFLLYTHNFPFEGGNARIEITKFR
ncbi:MAG: hypothetical protein WC975_00740 [Phycisphaerae bacterium]